MKYTFTINKEGNGYWAQCVEEPGIVTQGDTLKELVDNILDAVATFNDADELMDDFEITLKGGSEQDDEGSEVDLF